MTVNLIGNKNGMTLENAMSKTKEPRVLYFARDKADKRSGKEQCSELCDYLKERNFDVWMTQAQTNYLVMWGYEQ